MKKIILSAAVAAMAFSTSAMAADKGIDIVTTGQAVVYYETSDADVNTVNTAGTAFGENKGMFDRDNSVANVGIQLNLDADLKNNFTFGAQLSALGSAGLGNNIVGGVKQGSTLDGATTTANVALTKIFVAKKIANTTVKIGRQELPKSLSPLAFSEGWNVFKNTFDAILVVNSDIPKTTLVGAYVSGVTGWNDTTTRAGITTGGLPITKGAYMLTAQTTAIPMTTLTGTYYSMSGVANDALNGAIVIPATGETALDTQGVHADAYWLDAKIADKSLPAGLNIGLQAGLIQPDSQIDGVTNLGNSYAVALDDTTAYGAKVGAKVGAFSGSVAYTSVDGNDIKTQVPVVSVGGIKTPLFTQMVYNQNAISLDADTIVVKGTFNMGDAGSITAAYGMTDAGRNNRMNAGMIAGFLQNDYNEFNLIYKVKAAGVQYFAAFIDRDLDHDATSLVGSPANMDPDFDGNTNTADGEQIVRVWARYSF